MASSRRYESMFSFAGRMEPGSAQHRSSLVKNRKTTSGRGYTWSSAWLGTWMAGRGCCVEERRVCNIQKHNVEICVPSKRLQSQCQIFCKVAGECGPAYVGSSLEIKQERAANLPVLQSHCLYLYPQHLQCLKQTNTNIYTQTIITTHTVTFPLLLHHSGGVADPRSTPEKPADMGWSSCCLRSRQFSAIRKL